MKIRKLHIKNYKVFDDLELDFTDADGRTLNKVVLAGVNGCGKTTVLEMLQSMYDGTLQSYTDFNEDSIIYVTIELSITEKINIRKKIDNILTLSEIQTNNEYELYLKLSSDEKYFVLIYHKGIDTGLRDAIFNNRRYELLSRLLYLPVTNKKKNFLKSRVGFKNYEIIF